MHDGVAALLFVLSGISSTLLQQALLSAGAGDAWTSLLPFFNYLGMALLWRRRSPAEPRTETSSPSSHLSALIWACVALDIIGFLIATAAISAAGSGLYQVLYSSVVIFAALASWVVRRRALGRIQVVGIALVILGTALTARGGAGLHGVTTAPTPRALTGVALSLAAAAVYGTVYGLAELASTLPSYPGPHELASRIGRGVVAVLASYIAVAVLPRRAEVVARIAAVNLLSPAAVMAAFAALSASSAVHSLSYFFLVEARGATATGVMASLRAVGVYALSALLFCPQQPEQCWSAARAGASAVVVVGVLVFCAGAEGKPAGGGRRGKGEEDV